MRSFLVVVVLVFAVVPSPARAEAPLARAAASPSSGVRYRGLSRMIRKFRQEAEARAKERVLAQR
jgi:hypothetical protein